MKPVVEIFAIRINENLVIPHDYLEDPNKNPCSSSACGYYVDFGYRFDDFEQVCVNCDGSQCEYFEGIISENHNMDPYVLCSNDISVGFPSKIKSSAESIQSIAYRVFELIEPSIKQAIAQSIQEHFES